MSGAPDVRVIPADGKKEFRRFLELPYRIYDGDPNWVPPLIRDMKVMFDKKAHPFHQHSDVQPYIALRGDETVGRIVAIHNRNHVEYHEESVGFFGFFECVDEQKVANALLRTAEEWLRDRGLEVIRGPASFSTNEQAALLVDGFDRPPAIMMPYNPEYYEDLILNAGFRSAMDMVAYYLDNNHPPEYLLKLEQRLAKRVGVTLRTLRKEDFAAELDRVLMVYNKAWEKNWGFVPMTDPEIRHMADELKMAVMKDPEQVIFVESKEGEPVGFALWLKDYNQALIKARGRLFPFGLLKVLRRAKTIDMCRVLTLGLVEEYRHKGIDNLLYLRIFREGSAKGMTAGEFGWILEHNWAMRKPLEKMGSSAYKRYRMYDRDLEL
ncbi:MAG: N-acetyltransferase [marine benthic group bacterium]|nr:N-acetyltransferase [Candidatus Benthicola marisminoris]